MYPKIGNRPLFRWSVAVAFAMALCLSGCKDDSPELSDMEKTSSQRLRGLLKKNPYYSEQLQKAVSLWENGVCDPEPILFTARLVKWDSSDSAFVVFSSDEDSDLNGLVVREKHATDIFEETYPVSGVGFQAPIRGVVLVTARIRTQNQRKNEELWEQWLAAVDALRENEMAPEAPPIWVSIPEPNEVEVWVQLYDKAGHKSNRVKLRYVDNSQLNP